MRCSTKCEDPCEERQETVVKTTSMPMPSPSKRPVVNNYLRKVPYIHSGDQAREHQVGVHNRSYPSCSIQRELGSSLKDESGKYRLPQNEWPQHTPRD